MVRFTQMQGVIEVDCQLLDREKTTPEKVLRGGLIEVAATPTLLTILLVDLETVVVAI